MAQQKVLRAVLHADVRVLDPIWTTQTIANIHGMLVYDTLFGNDADMQPKPQMVDTYEITEDKLVYTFTLRDKLKFHDGSPVTSARRDRLARAAGARRTASASGCSPSSTSSRRSTPRPSA